MNEQVIYSTSVKEIAKKERLSKAFSIQKKLKKPAFYVLPSHMWLQAARKKQPGLLITTFDDIASYLLKQAGHSYFSLSEHERSLFFQQFLREKNLFDETIHDRKAESFANTYGQIKRLGLRTDELPPSLQSLHTLFTTYEQTVVTERNLLDPENQILRAIHFLEQIEESVEVAGIMIDGFYDFSPLQALFIEALKKAGVHVEVYVPNDEPYEVVDGTVSELIAMGFKDGRENVERQALLTEKEFFAATTEEEQWCGIMEDIRLSRRPLDEVGILIADEKNGMEKLEYFTAMYELPLNKSKKRPLSTTAIHTFLLAALKRVNRPQSKWENLPFVECILKLYGVSGLDYAKQKQLYMQTGEWKEEPYGQLFLACSQMKWRKNERFVDYLQQLEEWIAQLSVVSYWESELEIETDVRKLKEYSFEYKAWAELLQQIQAYRQLLLDKGLKELNMSFDLLVEWVKDLGKRVHLFEERAVKRGVSIYTWRDVGLFHGEKLYVVGMNEGVFPNYEQLSGYVQERDLLESPIRFSAPTLSQLRQKQEAYFRQLDYVAPSVTFTYIKGVDPNHPLLHSPFLESIGLTEREWSSDRRMRQQKAFSERDMVEKVAYHLGKGYMANKRLLGLETVRDRLNRLAEAEENVPLVKGDRVVAVTALENYARCPFRFAMDRVLGVNETKAEQERISPLNIGQLIHDLIEEIYTELDFIGVPFAEIEEEKLTAAFQLLQGRFEEKWQSIEKEHHELSRIEIELAKNEWQKRLLKWWQAEKKHFWENEALGTMSIFALEKPVRLPFSLKDGEQLVLTGKVDRIDVSSSSFVIYDYKTGEASARLRDVRSALKLQLPLYALAVSKELERNADGATYISLKEPEKRAGNGIWHPDHIGKNSKYNVSSRGSQREETLGTEEFLAKYDLKDRIERLWNGMNSNFPVKPLDCQVHCPYRSVCRVTPEQIEKSTIT